ncbi:MAG: secretion protein HlyD [Deltaproteobacteria bacterium CG11_big_fil_rev_8_21_14_0_20_49_13]|nr:MAG: secretion protein HlyD [Deltaproteobacteria bacterium CG11_big_fil_rev_8_21_14_0_20_49_13]
MLKNGLLKKFKVKDPKFKKKAVAIALVLIAVVAYFVYPSDESIYVGTIETTEVDVAPRVHSQVAARLVDEGDNVNVGETLYTLTCEDYIVAFNKARNDFERAEKLLKTGNMSPEQYDAYKKSFEDSKLNVEWCTVKAPIDGIILTKFHEAGDWVNIGTKLMAMGDLRNDVWAYVYVNQPLLVQLSIGEDVTGVLPELHDKKIPGKIVHIKDEAEFTPKNVQTRKERTRLVYGVKVKFDNSEMLLKPGMPIEVRFIKKVD